MITTFIESHRGTTCVSPVDIGLCPMLSAIASELFTPQHQLLICGCQDFAFPQETDDNLRATNSPDIATIALGYLVTKSFGV